MGFSKKSFISGMLIGFFVGSSMIFIVALGAGFLIIKDPHGPLAKLVINKLHLYSGVLGPLVSIKHLAEIFIFLYNKKIQGQLLARKGV